MKVAYVLLDEISKAELKRNKLHIYITMKLEERDYHAVADGAMDLRELESRLKTLMDVFEA